MREFRIQTQIDKESLQEIYVALKKTVNKKRYLIENGIGWFLVIFLVAILVLGRTTVNRGLLGFDIVLAIVVSIFLLTETKLLAVLAYRNTTQEMKDGYEVIFSEENYVAKLPSMEVTYDYSLILQVCESDAYILFVLGKNQCQVYKKSSFDKEYDAFKGFIVKKTGLDILKI